MQPADAGIILNLKAKYRERLLRQVAALLDGENTASAIIKGVTVLDAIRWLKLSWDEVNENAIRNCFQKCGFSQLENTTEAAQDDAEFEDLLQLLTAEVAAEDYLSFDHDVETHEQAINTAQVDWCETTRTRSIQEVTCNSEDEEMMVGNEESDDEVEKVLVEPKPIEVLEMLQKVKSFAINSSDAKLTERFEYLYKHV